MIKLLTGLILVVPLAVTAIPPSAPCICPRDRQIVCGSNGKTYSSECTLNCAIRENPDLRLLKIGACESVQVVDNTPPPACVCPFNYKPVCGTDGNSYSNECALNCAKRSHPTLQVSRQGLCNQVDQVQVVENTPTPANCICTYEYAPVCASNGKTYPNFCVMNCEKGVDIRHRGACSTVNVASPNFEEACVCANENRRVCGTDGVTYSSPCRLNCARLKNDALHILHTGPCKVTSVKPNQRPCTCNRDMEAVCGTDSVTYGNACLLACAAQDKPGLSLLYIGQCVNPLANNIQQ